MASRKNGEVYQFKVVLRDVSPPIWRTFQVWEDATLGQLHRILQIVMGWENYHLYEFLLRGKNYGDPDLDDEWEILDAKKTRLRNVLPGVGTKFEYKYDFGDGWRHELLVEAVMLSDPSAIYPRCISGRRSCPPEDVGGPYGYAGYLEALADPGHKEHENMMMWRGPFDPEAFSIEKVNRALNKEFPAARKKAARISPPGRNAGKRGTQNEELASQAIMMKPVSPQTKRIRIGPNETVPLELNKQERELILSHTFADESLTNRLRVEHELGERPIFRYSLDDLDDLFGFVAAEANHSKNKIQREQLLRLCDKIETTLSQYTDEAYIN